MIETGGDEMHQVVHSGVREEQEDSGGGGGTEQVLGVDMSENSSDGVLSSQEAAHNPEIASSSEPRAIESAPQQGILIEDDSQAQSKIQQQQALVHEKDIELRQLQKTHDEYVKSSCEYEKELEVEVELCERKVAALEQQTRIMETTNGIVSKKLAEAQVQLESTHAREQLLLKELEEMKWKVQRLEQANDELETAARIAQASIEDLEHKNETLLEQNVYLQQEKEELGRQMACVPVAEVQVHPAPASVCSSFNSSSSNSSFSHALVSGLHNSEKSPATITAQASQQQIQQQQQVQQQNLRGKNKAKGRYPDVVESCIHITCRKCRPSHHHNHNHRSHHSRAHRSSLAATSSFEHRGGAGGGSASEGVKKKAQSVFERLRLRFRAIFDCSASDGKQPASTTAAKAPSTPTAT